MLTKAYIKTLPESGDNVYTVEVPLLEDNTGTEAVFSATLCSNGDNYNNYSVGDCVYVQFEDQYYNNAVIMGKLYTETPTDSKSYTVVNELKVTNTATLPPNTSFGTYTAQDLYDLRNAANNSMSVSSSSAKLKEYVRWINTVSYSSEGSEGSEGTATNKYADRIQCMTGKEYDDYRQSAELFDEDTFNNTLFFLSTPSPSENENGDIQ